jgi:glycosyltransferase involved in cell wall biosynthesis
VEVIPNPVHFPLPCQEPVLDPESVKRDLGAARILLGVGRLEKQKGFDRLLNAFSSLSSRYPDWGMVILGEGALRAELEKQATALGIAARVRLPGAVGNIGQWYEAADLYALTSRFEGFPNTLLEALACGVPAVAVDCETGPGEILRDGTDGLLIPQDHPKALADALKRLMRDAELRNRFSRHAVAVRERFAVERIVEQWEQLFRELGKSGRQ